MRSGELFRHFSFLEKEREAIRFEIPTEASGKFGVRRLVAAFLQWVRRSAKKSGDKSPHSKISASRDVDLTIFQIDTECGECLPQSSQDRQFHQLVDRPLQEARAIGRTEAFLNKRIEASGETRRAFPAASMCRSMFLM